MGLRAMLRPGMRGYLVPLGAGVLLAASAFLPWVIIAGVPVRGVPDIAALWVLGLGLLSAVLATLSLITRKNSRHPLLVVGLAALGITYLSSRIMPRLAIERAITVSQAFSIVENRPAGPPPVVLVGAGLYLGLAASLVIVGFGLTIVLRRVARPYALPDPNDDV